MLATKLASGIPPVWGDDATELRFQAERERDEMRSLVRATCVGESLAQSCAKKQEEAGISAEQVRMYAICTSGPWTIQEDE